MAEHGEKHGRTQRGSVLVEYLAVLLALLTVWQGLGFVMDHLSEHQDEYTWSISQPY